MINLVERQRCDEFDNMAGHVIKQRICYPNYKGCVNSILSDISFKCSSGTVKKNLISFFVPLIQRKGKFNEKVIFPLGLGKKDELDSFIPLGLRKKMNLTILFIRDGEKR